METMMDWIQGVGLEVLGTIAVALFATTVLDDALAAGLSRIPVVGGALAAAARRLSARFRAWMLERVPKTAEGAVKEVEHAIGATGTGAIKAELATEKLEKREPGLTRSEAEREVQAAYDRLMGEKRLAAHEVK